MRPVQCRTYPWWPELLGEADWSWERGVCARARLHPVRGGQPERVQWGEHPRRLTLRSLLPAGTESVCEGFDHPDAPPADVADARRQLRDATVHAIQRSLASDGARRRRAGDGAVGAPRRQGQGSARNATLQELLGVMAAMGPGANGENGVNAAVSGEEPRGTCL